MPKFRSAYDGIRSHKGIDFTDDPGFTIQEQYQQTEINTILDRYQRTGIIDHVQKHEPQYGEFAAYDFHANQNMIVKITESFNDLPAKTRSEFDHDPAKFVEFLADQHNIEDMRDGIIGDDPKPDLNADPKGDQPPPSAEPLAD